MDSHIEVVPKVLSGIASAHVCMADSAKATGTGIGWFGAILSPHRQLQIAHMASVSQSMPLSAETERETVFGQ